MEFGQNSYGQPEAPKPAQAEDEKNGLKYFKSLFRIFVVFFGGLSVFFIAGFIVIKIRVADKTELLVPDLTGKIFIDEHNSLFEEGFRIELEPAYSTEYPQGYILAQNLSPGEIAKEGDKLILLVNHSKALIQTPKITGISENLVEGLLKDIPVGGRKYSLQIGVVTRMPNKASKGEILAQSPPAGTPVIPDYPISILVSDGLEPVSKRLNIDDLRGTDLQIIQKLAYLRKIPLVLETKRVLDEKWHGKVYSIKEQENSGKKTWRAAIGKFSFEDEEKGYPFQLRWVDPEEEDIPKGVYTVARASIYDETEIVKPNEKEMIEENEELTALIQIENRPIPLFFHPSEKIVFYEGYIAKKKKNTEPSKVLFLKGAEL